MTEVSQEQVQQLQQQLEGARQEINRLNGVLTTTKNNAFDMQVEAKSRIDQASAQRDQLFTNLAQIQQALGVQSQELNIQAIMEKVGEVTAKARQLDQQNEAQKEPANG